MKDLIYAVGIAPQKLADVAAIREAGCDLKIILDNVAAAKAVSAFCTRRGVTIPVLIEVDCDGHRSGVRPESELLIEIARASRTAPSSRAFSRMRAQATTSKTSPSSAGPLPMNATGS